jgi:plastocyanin
MTDTPTIDEEPETATADTAETAEGAPAPAPPERERFWQSRTFDQFVVPLLLPVLVVLTVLVFVLNVSRMFLAAHGNLPVIIGTTILLIVLIGATLLSAGERMQTPNIVLITSIFLLVLAFSGWITLGHSEPEGEEASTLPPTLATTQTIKIVAAPGGALSYAPNTVDVETGLVKFEIEWAAPSHTFGFHEDTTRFEELKDGGAGSTSVGVGYFGEPGEYTFFCAIPGHEAAGMWGTVTAEGPPVTLEQAVADAGNPPDALAGGGEGGGE